MRFDKLTFANLNHFCQKTPFWSTGKAALLGAMLGLVGRNTPGQAKPAEGLPQEPPCLHSCAHLERVRGGREEGTSVPVLHAVLKCFISGGHFQPSCTGFMTTFHAVATKMKSLSLAFQLPPLIIQPLQCRNLHVGRTLGGGWWWGLLGTWKTARVESSPCPGWTVTGGEVPQDGVWAPCPPLHHSRPGQKP